VIQIFFRYTKINDLKQTLDWTEPEPAKFRSKGAGVGAIEGNWSAPEPESELRSFENFAPDQKP